MKRFISRRETLPVDEDWKRNVQPVMGKYECSQKMYHDGEMIGWIIKPRYE